MTELYREQVQGGGRAWGEVEVTPLCGKGLGKGWDENCWEEPQVLSDSCPGFKT